MTIITVNDQDGIPMKVDLELCKQTALKTIRNLSELETDNYDFSTTCAMLQSVCISVLLDCGWNKQELIEEITSHINDLDCLSKKRILH